MRRKTRRYLLITPAKNEEEFLPLVAKSVIGQSIQPSLWVIVDDGSTDNTPSIIDGLVSKFSWIHSFRIPPAPRDITFRYAYVCRLGFRHALSYAKKKGIPFDFIALLDADTVVEPYYFEKLILEFDKDPQLGIASGTIYIYNGKKWQKDPYNGKYPRGSGRMWSKDCFFKTGGYRPILAPDSVSNRMALHMGCNVKRFEHIKAYQLRPTSSAEGIYKGIKYRGIMAYYLQKPLLSVLGEIFANMYFNKTPLAFFAYTSGYVQSFLNGNKTQNKKIEYLFRSRNYSR